MGIVGTGVEQVPLLSEAQVAQFKRDGYLVLPAALDPDRCRATRDAMWETIGDYLPRMKRADPSTWGLITDEDNTALLARVPDGSGDPFFAARDTGSLCAMGPRRRCSTWHRGPCGASPSNCWARTRSCLPQGSRRAGRRARVL